MREWKSYFKNLFYIIHGWRALGFIILSTLQRKLITRCNEKNFFCVDLISVGGEANLMNCQHLYIQIVMEFYCYVFLVFWNNSGIPDCDLLQGTVMPGGGQFFLLFFIVYLCCLIVVLGVIAHILLLGRAIRYLLTAFDIYS